MRKREVRSRESRQRRGGRCGSPRRREGGQGEQCQHKARVLVSGERKCGRCTWPLSWVVERAEERWGEVREVGGPRQESVVARQRRVGFTIRPSPRRTSPTLPQQWAQRAWRGVAPLLRQGRPLRGWRGLYSGAVATGEARSRWRSGGGGGVVRLVLDSRRGLALGPLRLAPGDGAGTECAMAPGCPDLRGSYDTTPPSDGTGRRQQLRSMDLPISHFSAPAGSKAEAGFMAGAMRDRKPLGARKRAVQGETRHTGAHLYSVRPWLGRSTGHEHNG